MFSLLKKILAPVSIWRIEMSFKKMAKIAGLIVRFNKYSKNIKLITIIEIKDFAYKKDADKKVHQFIYEFYLANQGTLETYTEKDFFNYIYTNINSMEWTFFSVPDLRDSFLNFHYYLGSPSAYLCNSRVCF